MDFSRSGLTGLIFCFVVIQVGFAQQKITVEEYIEEYQDLAKEEMLKYQIPASITLAQGILESDCGNSPLAIEANNHFGIKCHKEWEGRAFYQDDDEKNECFRKYNEAAESYQDHSLFLTTRDRYKFLFNLDITDYKSWAFGLKEAGYATNPKYPELLIRIIEENGLARLDRLESKAIADIGQNSLNSTPNTQHSTLISGPPDVFEMDGRGGNDRIIFKNNGVRFIYARKGDDICAIASEFNVYAWQIYLYNDLSRKDTVKEGQKVYLEKKKRKASYDSHIVRQGESLINISQDYAIRLKSMSRKNGLQTEDQVHAGTQLKLR
jgi:LysM repeat protein